MSKIAHELRLIAAARQVSMEAEAKTVQPSDADLNLDDEFAEVARRAAASLDQDEPTTEETAEVPAATETPVVDAELPSDEPPTVDAELATEETADAPEATEAFTEDAAPVEEPASEEAPPVIEEPASVEPTPESETSTPEAAPADEPAPSETPEAEVTEPTPEAPTNELPSDEPPTADDASAEESTSTEEPPVEETGETTEETSDEQTAEATEAEEQATEETAEIETPAEADLDQLAAASDAGAEAVEAATDATTADVADDAASIEESVAEDTAELNTTEAVVGEVIPETSEETAAIEVTAPVEEATPEVAPVQAEAQVASAQPQAEVISQITALMEATVQAKDAGEVVSEARDLSDDLFDLAETGEAINAKGGVSLEALAVFKLALAPLARQMGVKEFDLGVSMEQFIDLPADARLPISLESIAEAILELEGAQPDFEAKAIKNLKTMVEAIVDALPKARQMVEMAVSNASVRAVDDSGTISLDERQAQILAVNGQFPTDLSDSLQQYVETGRQLLGPYLTNAFTAAEQASLIPNQLSFNSTEAFWDSLFKVICNTVDPRTLLSTKQKEDSLPGGAKLFGPAQTLEDETIIPALRAMIEFNNSYAPQEMTIITGASVPAVQMQALSSSKITLIGKAFLEICPEDKIAKLTANGLRIWTQSQESTRSMRENLRDIPAEFDSSVYMHLQQIIKYVDVCFALSTWPILQYLSNLVITMNAFAMVADLSLKAEVTPAPAEEPKPEDTP